jgi:ankyrin repeat protein
MVRLQLDVDVQDFLQLTSPRSCIADAWEYAHQRPGTAESQLAIWRSSDLGEVAESQQLPILTKIVLKMISLDINSFLQASSSSIDDVDSYNRTALYWACSRGDDTTVQTLLNYRADVSLAERTGLTPLHIADSAAIVELLIAAGAKTDIRDTWDRTPLHWATYQGKSVKVVSALITGGADVNISRWNSSGYAECALHMAADFGNDELVQCLLEHGAEIDLRPHKTSLTPLGTAVWRSKPLTVQLLLARGADPGIVCAGGQAILHLAAAFADMETMGVLSANLCGNIGELDMELRNDGGQTARQVLEHRDGCEVGILELFDMLSDGIQRFRRNPILGSLVKVPGSKSFRAVEGAETAGELDVTVMQLDEEYGEDDFFDTFEMVQCEV